MVEVCPSYEMVRNFKAFVMFAVKNIGSFAYLGRKMLNMLILVRKIFFEYVYVRPENFFDLTPPPPPPHRQHVREKFVGLGQNSRKCWSKHDDTPPMLMASRRPCIFDF